MKKGIVLLAACAMGFAGYAQQTLSKCASADVINYQEGINPGYKARVNAAFDATKQIAEANKANRASDDTVYVINTVFHIVYTAAGENIPDSVIYSQMEVLNEDYRRLNTDTVKTRNIFADIVGDTRIQFELADIDPNGNPTNGITRAQGAPTGFLGFDPFSDGIKTASTGGVNAWPTDKYLNIWVCNVMNGFGILGYAFPPVGAANWPQDQQTDSAHQGVVLHFPAVGRNFSAPIDPTVAKGRSAVHEVGHYLGLRHIWGDGDCTEDDGLADTPDAIDASQQTCDTTKNTCVGVPVDLPDMIENYMDYSDDRCLNAFTHDQIGIMRGTLQTSRSGIVKRKIYDADSVTTSVSDIKIIDAAVSVYPNPTKGAVNFDVKMSAGSSYTVSVYNTIGEVVLNESTASMVKNGMLDLSGKPAGIYYAKFIIGDETFVKRVQIIN